MRTLLLSLFALPAVAGTVYLEITCYTPFSKMTLLSAPSPQGPWTEVTNIYYEFSTNFDKRPVTFYVTNNSPAMKLFFTAEQH